MGASIEIDIFGTMATAPISCGACEYYGKETLYN